MRRVLEYQSKRNKLGFNGEKRDKSCFEHEYAEVGQKCAAEQQSSWEFNREEENENLRSAFGYNLTLLCNLSKIHLLISVLAPNVIY
jgi:hypothetical protein